MDLKTFETLVQKALEELPEEFGEKLSNVDIVIEGAPDLETAKKLGLTSQGRLLGLYQGTPIDHRSVYYGTIFPDKISLYQANIERACKIEGKDVYEEIKHVLQHEIAHHFGISDQKLREGGTY